MRRSRLVRLWTGSLCAVGLLAACGGGEKREEGGEGKESEKEEHGAAAATGKVIVITATTDEKGNYFSPSEVEAHRGDVLRFTLVVGVHNVHFLPDSNVGKTGLPGPSELLQLPGQTIDIPVTFDEGTYYFQCDPHAALGMKGHLRVHD